MKKIVVTGSSGQIAYSLVFRLAHGDLFEKQEPISLFLYDIPGTEAILEGLAMELEDCAFPLLKNIQFGIQLQEMFNGVDLALLVGAKPRGPGMERGDLLKENGAIFVEQGRALNESANPEAKVIVVGNPCNTNALIAMNYAPNLQRKNFHAMMRLDQNRAIAQLAKKAKVGTEEVKCVTVWGNHSTTQIPDFTNARINNEPLEQVISEKKWLQEDFFDTVQKRGAQIIKSRGKSSAASAANALTDAVRSLYTPTPQGEWFTSAVCTDINPYGIESNLIFGFPCRSQGDGDYEIVPGLPLDFFIKEKMAITQKELLSERECIKSILEGV